MAACTFAYTLNVQKKAEDNRKWNVLTVSTSGASTSGTYPVGGIALSAASLGCPYGQVDTVDILDWNGDGYVYVWNKASSTIQIFNTTSGTGNQKLAELTSAISPSSTLTIEIKGY